MSEESAMIRWIQNFPLNFSVVSEYGVVVILSYSSSVSSQSLKRIVEDLIMHCL